MIGVRLSTGKKIAPARREAAGSRFARVDEEEINQHG